MPGFGLLHGSCDTSARACLDDDVSWGSTLTISANSTVHRKRQAGKGASDEQDPHVELPGIGESGAVSSNPISRNLSTKSVWFSRSVIRNPLC